MNDQTPVLQTASALSEGFQLSPQQKRLWSFQRKEETAYRAQAAVLIEGSFDLARFESALNQLLERHEILRTVFRSMPGISIPVQAIEETAFELDHVQRSASGTSDQNVIEKLRADFSDKTAYIDLQNGPLLHAAICTLSPEKHLLLVTLPSICADAQSLRNFARELSAIYQARETAHEAEPMQYADFAAWQSELLDAPETEAGRNYWSKREIAPLLDAQLPFATPSKAQAKFCPTTKIISLDQMTNGQLSECAEKHQVTPEIVLLTVWQALLGRLTGQSKTVVGVLFDGRKYPELQQALGLYAKLLPICCHWDERTTVTELFGQVQQTVRDAHEWQECFSWDLLGNVEEKTFFPFAFEFEEAAPDWTEAKSRFSLLAAASCWDRFQIKLHAIKCEQGVRLEFQYDPSTLDGEEIDRLAERFSTFLRNATAAAHVAVARLNMVGENERRKLLVEFNNSKTAPPKEASVLDLFEQSIARFPNQAAVRCGNESLTYTELNQRADAWAQRLRAAGITNGTPVGLCVERSVEMIVGLVAILKAGGAYVPLDPAYPAERLKFMIDETAAPVLLMQKKFADLFPAHQARTYFLDDKAATAVVSSALPPVTSDSLAYIIFTSGSTGKPKGVLVTHGNLLHSTAARLSYYGEPLTSYLLVSSFAFDSSVAGIFWTLASGGTLVLPQEGAQQDPQELLKLIEKNAVSHFLSLPSLYFLMLAEAKPAAVQSLRTVIVAGEACPKELPAQHSRVAPHAQLFNEYGPTEATVWSTVSRFSAAGKDKVTIGKPIANAQIYLLDSHLDLVPLGVAGEVFVGGAGIARGYLKRPELTAEKFIPDPFSNGTGLRLYRTGDLARWLPDGNLEFLGRIDHQVKIRGYRIELEEIETVLRQHSSVRDAVVIARDDAAAAPNASTEIDETVDSLAHALSSLEESAAQQILDQIEAKEIEAAPHSERRFQRFPEFEVAIEIKSPRFMRPPREAQRNWLLNRALKEFSDDLKSLDRAAQQFVPGTDYEVQTLVGDRTQGAIEAQKIMEDWHIPLMRAMARAVTEAHGDVLEIGFGRGISAGFLQEEGVRSHTIIECNDFVIGNFFEPWRVCQPDRDIRLVRGKWQDVLDQLQTYDGIFFQTYPLNEKEFVEYLTNSVTFAEHFFPTAAKLLKPGGAFTYLTHEIDSLSREHQRLLFKYFKSISVSVEQVKLPHDCKDLWWSDSMVVVKAVK